MFRGYFSHIAFLIVFRPFRFHSHFTSVTASSVRLASRCLRCLYFAIPFLLRETSYPAVPGLSVALSRFCFWRIPVLFAFLSRFFLLFSAVFPDYFIPSSVALYNIYNVYLFSVSFPSSYCFFLLSRCHSADSVL